MSNAPAQLDSEIPGAIPAISLAIRLRLAREHRAVSQIELADELGLGLSTVQRYEQGRYVPTKAVALAWAMATGTSSRWLLGARHSNGNMVLVQQLMRHESMLTTQRYMGWAPWGGTLIDDLYAA